MLLSLATEADAPSIVGLRDSLAVWQRDRGVIQWEPGQVGVEQVLEEIRRGEWHVLDEPGPIAAAVRIVDTDPIWMDSAESNAGYIHGLMVSRTRAGVGLGKAILSAAESIVLARGRHIVRLDCVASNPVLRAYYEEQGYEVQGRREFPPSSGWHAALLLEKKL